MSSREYSIVLVGAILPADIQATIFQRRGFRVTEAPGGRAAFERARAERPDLVVLGFRMPDATAPEICRSLREAPECRDVGIVVVTDGDDEEARSSSEAAGASAVVSRSAGLEIVMRTIADLLRIPSRRPVRMPVTLDFEAAGARKQSIGRAINISESGIGIEVSRPYAVDTDLDLRFQLPGDHRAIAARARVRWLNQGGAGTFALGLEFLEMEDASRRFLSEYVDPDSPGC